jgi:hypothetical protein
MQPDPNTVTNLVTEHGGRLVETFGAIAASVMTFARGLSSKLDKIIELLTEMKIRSESHKE